MCHVTGRTRMIFALLMTLVWAASARQSFAQELNCQVTIDSKALSGSDFEHLNDLKQQIEEYMNGRAWTDDTFQPQERIQCNMTVTFLEANTSGIDRFTARLTVGTLRPIYATPSPTTVLQAIDDGWQFEYDRNQSLFYDPERYNPLTSILDFYANLILGFDYDSFSELGGTVYFQRARRIGEIANTSGGAGWNAISDERSRAALIKELLDPRMEEYRKGLYRYYRHGLDLFLTDLSTSRENVLEVLGSFEELHAQLPNSYVLDLFFATKKQELTALFEDSNVSSQAYGLLLNIDPQNAGTYDQLIR